MAARQTFIDLDEYDSGWLAENDLKHALELAGADVDDTIARSLLERFASEIGQEEQGFLSIDEFERIYSWCSATTTSTTDAPQTVEPEPEPSDTADTQGDGKDNFDTLEYWEQFNEEADCYEWYSAGELVVRGAHERSNISRLAMSGQSPAH